ncbi:hypothetical protein V9T40_008520 [Parthenolecanium corni]|uniref:Nucleolar pre-ribosomal-associated protein 1 n=1 Tax=Parthenolecanium corni TaxID=536013 RepID=A0AAN9TYH1_9HEMI
MKRKLETNEDKSSVKVSKLVTSFGSAFRKNLKTNNGINALNDFILASKERDVVTEYIDSGGSAKELVSLLKQFDGKKDLVVASTVFAALQLIIVKTVDDLLLIQKNVEEVCEELLCSYHNTMQNMLSSSSSTSSYKKIVLKLLTGMITLSAGLGKKILTLFPINPKLLKTLTDSRASNTAIQLRTSFIHYLLSFLIDDNVILISELLKIKGLLTSIVPGLTNDKSETVMLVINTFRLKIVENVRISKTLKIHTFNTPILRSLSKLYDYKAKSDSKELQGDFEFSNSVQSVRLAVHSLLMILCTSFKKGMLFRERASVSGRSPNQLIFTLLEDMNGPWRDELKSELVTEILKVCPEFLKTIYSQLESSLQPNDSEDWGKLILFLKQIIKKQELNIEIQKEQSSVALVTSSFFPTIVQKLLRDHCDEKILHQSSVVRFRIFSLLEVCLSKISSFLEQCSPSLTEQSALSMLKDHVENFLSKNSVSCLTLLNVWNMNINVMDDDPILDISEYYHSLANVLLFYSHLCPVSFRQLQINEINLKKEDLCDAELQFKRAQLMYIILNPKPHHDLFASSLRQFICSSIDDEKETKIQVLQNMFLNTGFFEGFVDEVLVWMYCIQKIPVEHAAVISDLLVDVFAVTSKKYKNFLANIISITRDDEEFYEKTNLTTDLEYFVDIDEGLECNTKPVVLISPVIPALLSVLKFYEKSKNELTPKNSIKSFVLRIFSLTGEIHFNSLFYLLVEICRDFKENNSLPNNYSKLLSPYRQRLILFLLTKQRQNEPINFNLEACTIEDIIQFVMLNSRSTALLLNTFTMLPLSLLISDEKKRLSEWCTVIHNLFQISAKYLQHAIKNENLLHLLSNIEKLLALDINVDSLEISIINYLQSFPHHISSIPEEMSNNLIKSNPSIDKLALHLLAHHPSIRPILWNKISNNGESIDINELFEVARKVAPVSNYDHILETVYAHHFPVLISWIDSDCNWKLQNWLCSSLSHAIEIADNLNFLLGQDLWENFIKSALKISLQSSNSILLRTLRLICDKALTTDHTVETSNIFQMTISHSEFVNIILSKSEIKCELIEFYLLLTSKNEHLMSSNHVPLLLGSYNALLSKSDQLLLQVLQWYEENKIRFSDCKPYLWGDAAVTHYSIRTEISISLKRQPQPNQVLDLLDMNIVKNTLRYGPLDRALHPGKKMYVTDVDVYDLSFMLPLMSHLLASESRVSVQKFTRSGALALVLVSLSSQEAVVRMAGFHCLQRFQSHLNSREREIQIWDHFIRALKNGILALNSEDDDYNTPPILPCIVTNFLAHMSLIISEPLHSLYVPLTNFLLAKPSFDVNTIPNFLALFYSTDLKNRDYQEWILKIIRDGMRSEQDWITAQRCFLFKLLLQYYSSASSNEGTNVLVLEIVSNASKIASCKVNLVTQFGLLSWLNQIVQNNSDFNNHFLSCLVSILQSLKTVKNTSSVIFTILVLLHKLHSKPVDHQCIENLFEILSLLYCSKKKNVLAKRDIEFIIDFAVPYHSPKLDKICRNCIKYSSVVGVSECDSIVTNYIIRIIRRFFNNELLHLKL